MQTIQAVISPTNRILRINKPMDDVLGACGEAASTHRPLGKYESDVEALNLMILVFRNVEGVRTLAGSDLVLLPGAIAMARAAFEVSIRIRWMIDPDDPFEREIRWLAHLRGEESYHEKMRTRVAALGGSTEKITRLKETIGQFAEGVTSRLPKGYVPLQQIPNLDEMLTGLNDKGRYIPYILLSQFAHGSHVATGLYRTHLGSMKQLGEFITDRDWYTPFVVCSNAVHSLVPKLLDRIGADEAVFAKKAPLIEITEAISALKNPESAA